MESWKHWKKALIEVLIALNIFMLLVLIINTLSLSFTFLIPPSRCITIALRIYIGEDYTTPIALLLNTILTAYLISKEKTKLAPLALLLVAAIFYERDILSIISIATNLITALALRKRLKIDINKVLTTLFSIFAIIEAGTLVEYLLQIFKITDKSLFQKFHLALSLIHI